MFASRTRKRNSIDYAQKATDYVNEISAFANDAPALAEKAVNDSEARKELEAKLSEIKQDIPAFNELTPPDVARIFISKSSDITKS